MRKADNLLPYCAVVKKSRNLNFLDPSGPAMACNGSALPILLLVIYANRNTLEIMGNVMICSRLGYSSFPILTFGFSVVSLFGFLVIRKFPNGDKQITIKIDLFNLYVCELDELYQCSPMAGICVSGVNVLIRIPANVHLMALCLAEII